MPKLKERLLEEIAYVREMLGKKTKFMWLFMDPEVRDGENIWPEDKQAEYRAKAAAAKLIQVCNEIDTAIQACEIKGIAVKEGSEICSPHSRVGSFVKIKPCKEDKTYLGLYLGDIALSFSISSITEDTITVEHSRHNPAIFVFDLNKIVYGIESWWGIIENEDDLKCITDIDINNIWYVKALKAMSEKDNAVNAGADE